MKYDLTASIVLYNNEIEELRHVVKCFFSENELKKKLFLIDNSPSDRLKKIFIENSDIQYIYVGDNIGFGAGHNKVHNLIKGVSKCHLVMNADIDFEGNILKKLHCFLLENKNVALLSPKVLNKDKTLQYSCKLLPTPFNLIVRRFVPIKFIQNYFDYNYELRFLKDRKIMNLPYLTGCFMFLRTSAFLEIGGFDERFFMYPEDIDLTRRLYNKYNTLYYPRVEIVHEHGKGSYKSFKLLKLHVISMIKYFNKWGWFFDRDRSRINTLILKKYK